MGRNTYRCLNYTEADAIFNKRGAVRSTKWSIDQRPLDPKPVVQRYIKQGENAEYYDIVLYRTTMARFYKPTVTAGRVSERRLYMGHPSQTSQHFMYSVLWASAWNKLNAHEVLRSDGDDARTLMPVYDRPFMMDRDTPFSLDATFVDGMLDIAQSRHTPHYRVIAGREDKQRKAELVQKFDNYIMLAVMRMPEFEASVKLDSNLGRPFGGSGNDWRDEDAVKAMFRGDESQADIDRFFHMCQDAYNVLASKRGYEQGIVQRSYYYRIKNMPEPTLNDLAKPITSDDFRRAIIDRITKHADVETKSHREEVAQFPLEGKYPRTNLHL